MKKHKTAKLFRVDKIRIYGVNKMKKNINPVALEVKSMIMKSGYTQIEIVE